MDTDKGTAQTSLVLATSAATTSNNYFFAKFISNPLKGAQTVSANTWNFAFACAENNANANYPNGGTNLSVPTTAYVWRPSTGAKVGNIVDVVNSGTTFSEPGATNTETSEFGTFAGSAVTAADGDVIVFEVWARTTQGNATSRNDTFYFDGTTETNSTGTTVSNHASYIETPQNLVFYALKYLAATVLTPGSLAVTVTPTPGPNSDIKCYKGVLTADATGTVHDQSFTGFGFQPKAVILWVAPITAHATYNEGASMSYGFSDGTRNMCVSGSAVDAVSTMDNNGMIRNDACISILSTASGTAELVRGVIKTFDSDGITITWNVKNTTQYLIHVMAFAGSDLTAKCQNHTATKSGTGTQGYTGYGFTPSVVFLACIGNIATNAVSGSSTTTLAYCVGAGKSTSQQFANNLWFQDASSAASSGTTGTALYNNRVLNTQTGSGGTYMINASLTSLDSDGFTLNHVSAAIATTFPFIALALSGGYWSVGTYTQRTTNGTQIVTASPSLIPTGLMLYGSDSTAANTDYRNSSGPDGNLSIGGADGVTEGSVMIGNQIVVSPTTCVMISRNDKILNNATPNATATSSTSDAIGDLTDFATNGQYTVTYTVTAATARQVGYVFLQKNNPLTQQNITKSLSRTVTVSVTPTRLNNKFRTNSATITIVGPQPTKVKIKNALKTLSAALLVTGNRARLAGKTRALSRSITIVAVQTRLEQKFRALSRPITIVAALTRPTAKQRALAATLLVVATRARLSSKIRTRTATIFITNPSLTRLAQKIRLRSATILITANTPTKQRTDVRTLVRTVLVSSTLARQTAKIRSRTASILVTQTAFTRLLQKIRTLAATLTIVASAPTDVKQRRPQRTLSATVTVTGNINRLLARTRALSRSLLISAIQNRLAGKIRPISPILTISEVKNRIPTKSRFLSRSLLIQESKTRISGKARSLARSVTVTGTPTYVILFGVKQVARTLDQAITVAGSPTKLLKKVRSTTALVSIIGTANRVKSTAKILTQSVLVASSFQKLKEKRKQLSENITISGSTTRLTGRIRQLTLTQFVQIRDALNLSRIRLEIVWVYDQVTYVKTHIRHIEISMTESIHVVELARYNKGLHKLLTQFVHIGPHVLGRVKSGRRFLAPFVKISEKLRLRKVTPGLVTKRGMNRTILDMKITTQSSHSRDLQQYPSFALWVHNIIRTMKFRRYPT